ncbi:hypothetical protein IKX12_02600 [Candidatus Saccharibacteria bacterium]|nr:hypothetical protein [Candidatus Saccharibacteria bacterium]
MQIYKRVRFTKNELKQLCEDCDGYVWAALDAKKYAISLGDSYLEDLRDVLLLRRCRLEDVFGIGFDLNTGEIKYISFINRRNPMVGCKGELTPELRENVEDAIHYFFENLPAYQDRHNK